MDQEQFTTRRLTSMKDFAELVELQRNFADIDSKYIVAEKVFHVLAGEGGAVVGIYDGMKQLRGFAVHFPSFLNNQKYARTYRTLIDPMLRRNDLEHLLRIAQINAADSDDLPALRFEVPILPYECVKDALVYPGARGDELTKSKTNGSHEAHSLLISWPTGSKKLTTDYSNAPGVLEVDFINDQPRPGDMNLKESAPILLVPAPTQVQWEYLGQDLRELWISRISEILSHYLNRSYAIVEASDTRQGEICPNYILSNSLL